MAYVSPLEDLYTDTVARLTAQGSTLLHRFGERHIDELMNVGRYVWIPTRIRVNREVSSMDSDHRRMLYPTVHLCEVHCWGKTRETAYAMAGNLIQALHYVGHADIELDECRWDDEEGNTDHGYVLTVEFGLRASFADEFVPIEEYAGTAQSLDAPDAPSVETEAVAFEVYAGPNTDANHELMASDEVIDE